MSDPAELSAPSVPYQLSGPGADANNALLNQQSAAQDAIRKLLLQRLMQQQGTMPGLAPPPPMLGQPPRSAPPTMIPGTRGASGAY